MKVYQSLAELKEQMQEAAQRLEFERAAEIRDLIREIEGDIS